MTDSEGSQPRSLQKYFPPDLLSALAIIFIYFDIDTVMPLGPTHEEGETHSQGSGHLLPGLGTLPSLICLLRASDSLSCSDVCVPGQDAFQILNI